MCVGVCIEEHDEWTQLKTRVSGPALTLTLGRGMHAVEVV